MTKQRKSAHFRRPYQKPQVDRSKPTNPALEFAIAFNMLSDEEIEDVRHGIANISKYKLCYKHGLPRGSLTSPSVFHLYKDRRLELLKDRLLGLDEEPKT